MDSIKCVSFSDLELHAPCSIFLVAWIITNKCEDERWRYCLTVHLWKLEIKLLMDGMRLLL